MVGQWRLPQAYGLALSPDGKRIAGGFTRGSWLLDVASGRVRELEPTDSTIWWMAFSADGRWLVRSGDLLGLFDGESGASVLQLPNGGLGRRYWVGFTPESALLHAGLVVQRLELRPVAAEVPPEAKLKELLERYRLHIVDQQVQADAPAQ